MPDLCREWLVHFHLGEARLLTVLCVQAGQEGPGPRPPDELGLRINLRVPKKGTLLSDLLLPLGAPSFTLVAQEEAQRMPLGWSPCLQVDKGTLRLAGSGGKGVSAEGQGRRGKGGEEDGRGGEEGRGRGGGGWGEGRRGGVYRSEGPSTSLLPSSVAQQHVLSLP